MGAADLRDGKGVRQRRLPVLGVGSSDVDPDLAVAAVMGADVGDSDWHRYTSKKSSMSRASFATLCEGASDSMVTPSPVCERSLWRMRASAISM